MIIIPIAMVVSKELINSYNIINEKAIMNRAMYVIASDIRYNFKFNEVKNLLNNKKVYYEVNENILEELEDNSIFMFNDSNSMDNYIAVEKLTEEEVYMNIKVHLVYKDIEIEKIITKAIWMDEV